MNNFGLVRYAHKPLVRLIIAHFVLLFLAIYGMTMNLQNYRWPRYQSMFIEVVALSQISLLSCWYILGRTHWVVRISLLPIGVTFWIVTLRACGLNQEHWLTIALIQVSGICLMLLAVRIRGYTLVDLSAEKVASNGQQEHPSKLRQFSLFQLLVFISIGALFLGMSKILFSDEIPTSLNRGDTIRAPGLGLAVAILAITMVWTILFAKNSFDGSFYSTLIALFVLLCTCLGVGKLDQLYRTSWWSSLGPQAYQHAYWILLILYTFAVSLSLWVVRLAGLRIEKTRATSVGFANQG